MNETELNKENIKQPTIADVAKAIRLLSDTDLVQIYQLAIAQLQSITVGLESKIRENLVKNKKESE